MGSKIQGDQVAAGPPSTLHNYQKCHK